MIVTVCLVVIIDAMVLSRWQRASIIIVSCITPLRIIFSSQINSVLHPIIDTAFGSLVLFSIAAAHPFHLAFIAFLACVFGYSQWTKRQKYIYCALVSSNLLFIIAAIIWPYRV